MESKTALRIKAKAVRKSLNISKLSERAVDLIRNHEFYKKSKSVMIFYPMKFEINLLPLLEDNKNFYLPRVNGEKLDICPYKKDYELKKSSFNVFEPCTEPSEPAVLDLVIVPALMADKYAYRLGYGGGFYDRFLSSAERKFKTLAVVPKELFTDKLPVDKFDIKLDDIIII